MQPNETTQIQLLKKRCENYLKNNSCTTSLEEAVCKAISTSELIGTKREDVKEALLKQMEIWIKLYGKKPDSEELVIIVSNLIKIYGQEIFLWELKLIQRMVLKNMLPVKINIEYPVLSFALFNQIMSSYLQFRAGLLAGIEVRLNVKVNESAPKPTKEEEVELNKQIVSDEFDYFMRSGDVLDLMNLTHMIFVNNNLIPKNPTYDENEGCEMNEYVSKKLQRAIDDEREKNRNLFGMRDRKDATISYQKNFQVRKVFRMFVGLKPVLLKKITKP